MGLIKHRGATEAAATSPWPGLSRQGEFNIDVLDHDACQKLAGWFEDRWNDRWCLDISAELVRVIAESWARVEPVPPYLFYAKMADRVFVAHAAPDSKTEALCRQIVALHLRRAGKRPYPGAGCPAPATLLRRPRRCGHG